jgi:class 3 adenylate cyclase
MLEVQRLLLLVTRTSDVLGLHGPAAPSSGADFVFSAVLDALLDALPWAHSAFALLGSTLPDLRVTAARCRDGLVQADAPFMLSRTLCAQALRHRAAVTLVDTATTNELDSPLPSSTSSFGGVSSATAAAASEPAAHFRGRTPSSPRFGAATAAAAAATASATPLGSDGTDTPQLIGAPAAPPGIRLLRLRTALVCPLLPTQGPQPPLGLIALHGSEPVSITPQVLTSVSSVARQLALWCAARSLADNAQREASLRRNLCRYLPAPLVHQVLKGAIDVALGGKIAKGATILFADICGFTRMCEPLQPTDVIQLVNRCFERSVPHILGDGGSVDKFIGDCVMAVWGAGAPRPDGCAAAIRAGLAMQNSAFLFSCEAAPARDFVVQLGVGINTGDVVVGNVGTNDRLEFTALGDAVNTTQRIESSSCPGMVLVSSTAIRSALSDGAAGGSPRLPSSSGPPSDAAIATSPRQKRQMSRRMSRAPSMSVPAAAPQTTAAFIHMPGLNVKNKTQPLHVVSVRAIADKNSSDMVLSVPVDGPHGENGLLIRRLADQETFVLLHGTELKLAPGTVLTTTAPELPFLGSVEISSVVTQLGAESNPSTSSSVPGRGAVRSLIRFSDKTMNGLMPAVSPVVEMTSHVPWSELSKLRKPARRFKPKSGGSKGVAMTLGGDRARRPSLLASMAAVPAAE